METEASPSEDDPVASDAPTQAVPESGDSERAQEVLQMLDTPRPRADRPMADRLSEAEAILGPVQMASPSGGGEASGAESANPETQMAEQLLEQLDQPGAQKPLPLDEAAERASKWLEQLDQ